MSKAFINAISTGVPAYEVHNHFDAVARRQVDERTGAILARTNKKSGIERRYSVIEPLPIAAIENALDVGGDFIFDAFPSTGKRMALYDREAAALATTTVEGLGVDHRSATHLIVCSCTGFAAPGVDLQLIETLALSPTIHRTVVGFMGCFAAINSLRLARSIVLAEPDSRVLVVAIELCTLHIKETADIDSLLSFMIFSDGCAAALVTAEPGGLQLDGFATALVPAARNLITWHVGDGGFDMVLSTKLPGALAAALPEAVRSLGASTRTMVDAVDLWAIHPGGKAILDAAERTLGLPPEALFASRKVLRDYGNMSSATVMFVLAHLMREAPNAGAQGLAMAFGPGLTAEGMRFTVA